uniref:Uncharacterized protein n=1 Tax=Nelumbo nucifera TaxID=4432 RepID=A0A822XGG1_NELNU|nr:TPA_asm: hypothetical protein HUJ06_019653 [Nelumbo nucifera]DAD18191.1 TPA_asm: hypothetical protein HUJ06_019654 [Nelumbo nucifera]
MVMIEVDILSIIYTAINDNRHAYVRFESTLFLIQSLFGGV